MTRSLGMFPLSTVLFPGAGLSLHVFEERYRRLMADCLAGDGEFGVVLITRGSEVGGGDQRAHVGTTARIRNVTGLGDGRMLIAAEGSTRIVIDEWLDESTYPRALVGDLPHSRREGAERAVEGAGRAVEDAGRAVRRLRSLLSELGAVPALPYDLGIGPSRTDETDLTDESDRSDEADLAGWRLCELAPLNLIDRQRLLVCAGLVDRMELLCELSTAMADDVVSLLAGGLEA